jgi:hypothetical protein
MQNREKMKTDQAQKKAIKMAATEAYRSKKPGECRKVSGYFTFYLFRNQVFSDLQSCKYFLHVLLVVPSPKHCAFFSNPFSAPVSLKYFGCCHPQLCVCFSAVS